MQLDTRTAAVLAIFVTLILSLLGLLIWRTRQTYPGFGRWTIGNLLVTASLLLFSLRGIAPDWISVIAGNALSISAAILILEGSRQFRGLRAHLWFPYVAGAITILALIYFDYLVINVSARIVAASAYLGIMGFLGAITLLRDMPPRARLGMAFTGTVFALCGLGHVIRGIYFLTQPPFPDLFAPSAANTSFFVGVPLAVIGWSFGFFLLTNERLVIDLKDAESQTTNVNRELGELQLHLEQAVETRTAELRRAQEALGSTNEALTTIIQAAPVAMIALDSTGNIKTWNKTSERVFGWTEREVRDRPIPFRTGNGHESRILSGEVLTGVALSCVKKDGSLIEASLSGAPLQNARGDVTGSLLVFEDITERKRILESQKLESIGRLAGGVAHDFNNFLTVISGYSQLLASKLGEFNPLQRYMDQMTKAADQAAFLTKQLLAFGRRQTLKPEVVDLNAVIQGIEEMLSHFIEEDIEVVTVLGPTLYPVKADPGQMRQVMLNLVLNARDAMPQGGRLLVETANVDLTEIHARQHPGVSPGRYAMLAVSDTGIGMDAETRTHMFEPFFTTKEQGKGTGLGLAIVYGVIKQSGGHTSVRSEPGKGTTFNIYLPPADEPLTSGHVFEAPATEGSETILVVEDRLEVRRLVCEALQEYGYRVLEAANGVEALALCEEFHEHLDLLITDVVMPGMGGRELAERLSSLRPETGVLYMSGYTDDLAIQQGASDAAPAFLQKPFTPADLVRKVRAVLDAND